MTDGFIYVMKSQSSGFYKIGTSLAPLRRLHALQTADPSIELCNTYPTSDMYLIERLVHRRLQGCRIKREWFHLSPEMLSWLHDLLSGRPVREQPPQAKPHQHNWHSWG